MLQCKKLRRHPTQNQENIMKRSPIAATIAITAALAAPVIAQDDAKPAKPAAAVEEKAPAAPAAVEKPAAPAEIKVLAKVDGVAITETDAEQRFLAMYGPRLASMPPAQADMMRQHAMQSIKEELIAKTLLLAAAAKADIKVDEKKQTEMLTQVQSSIPPGTTMEQFYANMKMDAATFKEAIGEEVRINALLDSQTKSVPDATDEETKKFYTDNEQQFVTKQSVKASHILVKTDGLTDEAEIAKKKAEIEDIRKQLIEKKGENFTELAKAHSECPSSAQGGSLGDFGPGQMVPEFDKAAFSQEVGVIGEIVKTNFGYHVILVDEKTEAGKTAYDEIKARIAEHLKNEKQGEIIQAYIAGLREKATIEDLSKPEPAPAVPGLPGLAPAAPAPAPAPAG